MYALELDPMWGDYFQALPEVIKIRVLKKIDNIILNPYKWHMEGAAKFFVAEVGQYRLTYFVFENTKTVRFYFIGKHKEYEKWHKSFF
jgi:mRNA-degrading endonuclease RelE of RelBE toxin-antitoxin system